MCVRFSGVRIRTPHKFLFLTRATNLKLEQTIWYRLSSRIYCLRFSTCRQIEASTPTPANPTHIWLLLETNMQTVWVTYNYPQKKNKQTNTKKTKQKYRLWKVIELLKFHPPRKAVQVTHHRSVSNDQMSHQGEILKVPRFHTHMDERRTVETPSVVEKNNLKYKLIIRYIPHSFSWRVMRLFRCLNSTPRAISITTFHVFMTFQTFSPTYQNHCIDLIASIDHLIL